MYKRNSSFYFNVRFMDLTKLIPNIVLNSRRYSGNLRNYVGPSQGRGDGPKASTSLASETALPSPLSSPLSFPPPSSSLPSPPLPPLP